jgi:NAD(P)-dependent dehydrogenase (short-subunit alcohol dehydrogenase family)
LQLDLASLDSVREFSKKFHEVEAQLHILINNAGVMACPKGLTKDGFETHMGTNHLGHFLLTNLLLDLVKAASPSRIVVVSSEGHKLSDINRDDFMCEKSYSRFKAYGQSKLANILFAKQLANKVEGSGVTVNSCHPGVVGAFFKTPWEGAQTQLFLALDPDLDNVTGKYFTNCSEKMPSVAARSDETAEWLYNKSLQLVNM